MNVFPDKQRLSPNIGWSVTHMHTYKRRPRSEDCTPLVDSCLDRCVSKFGKTIAEGNARYCAKAFGMGDPRKTAMGRTTMTDSLQGKHDHEEDNNKRCTIRVIMKPP